MTIIKTHNNDNLLQLKCLIVDYLCVFQNAIHNHIRLFEPLVIKALKQYTTSTSVALQRQVLDLLAQLVQLRVNYCLLDSDQVSLLELWIKLRLSQNATLLN